MSSANAHPLESVHPFSGLPPEARRMLAATAEVKRFGLGKTVAEAGESISGVYLVRSGRCRRLVEDPDGDQRTIETLSPGDLFGTAAVSGTVQAEWTVRASEASEILFIPSAAFHRLFSKDPDLKKPITDFAARRACETFLMTHLSSPDVVIKRPSGEIMNGVRIRRITTGQRILQGGEIDGTDLFIVRSGEIRLTLPEGDALATLKTGGIFGERACIQGGVQQAAAEGAGAVVLALTADAVKRLMSDTPGLEGALQKRIRWTDREIERIASLRRFQPRKIQVDVKAKAGPGERLLKGFRWVEQAEESDCAAACLAMICRHYDVPATVGRLREMLGVSTAGASLESLSRVADSLGMTARPARCTYRTLMESRLPFIAHWKGNHYVVVYGISKAHVRVADPAKGFRRLTAAEFEAGWTGVCLLVDRVEEKPQAFTGKPSPWRRFARYLVPFKKILADLLLAALVIQVLGLAPPLIIQNILDRVIVHGSHDLLNLMLIGMGVAFLFRQITRFFSAYLMNFLIRKLDFDMISGFYRYVLSLPIEFFARRQVGDIVARFHENNTVRRFMTQGSISTLLNTMMIFTYFIVMFMYNVRLTLMLMAFLPPIILLTLLAAPKYKDYARKTFFAGADAQSLLVETLGGAAVVKGMGVERPMRLRWERKYLKTLDLRYRAEIFTAMIGALSGLLQGAAVITLLWVGTRMVMAGELTIGQLMAFNVLIGSVMAPLMGLVGVWDELQEALVSMERLGDVLDLSPEQAPEDGASRVILPDLSGEIRMENVFFRYGGQENPYCLKNIRMEIPAGARVAIVGPSGSGKTTLARLMVGFYGPTEGRVYVDGYDIRLLDLISFRQKVGYVMEQSALFSGTVTENIAVGDAEPDMRRVIECAQMANADAFIRNLAAGYGQVVGERGAGLSGGQIQRICIARALYHDPRVLILDEATSALDSETESGLGLSLDRILSARTGIIIAHRLSTVMHADQILVLYEGEIVESGVHTDLLNHGGLYFSLFRHQMAALEN